MRRHLFAQGLLVLLIFAASPFSAWGDELTTLLGAAKTDITPDYPIRLSGYGNRTTESEGVAQRIWAKALAIGGQEGQENSGAAVLITVENCGVPAPVVQQVAEQLRKKAGVPRERLVVASTHTHTGPYLAGGIPFMFAQEPPPDQQERIERYTRELTDKLVETALQAIAGRQPGRLYWTQGKVGFAINRRVVRNENWAGFGETPAGPVDHSLPILVAQDTGGKIIAILANYACHCTTLGGDFNQICGDWAGYAQEYIEEDHPGAVAMISIGCGADANPTPRGRLEMCQMQGRQLADEVKRLLKAESGKRNAESGERGARNAERGAEETKEPTADSRQPTADSQPPTALTPVSPNLTCRFDEIELPLAEPPSRAEWEAQAEQQNAAGRRARRFLKMLDEGKEIPRSVRYPVGVWTFGDDLAMVFLGGEVVVDYAIRMKEEFDADRLWITAYANDTPCYIASKRILREGGYEVDSSMIYYGQPTRLAPETEDLIIDTVHRLLPRRFSRSARVSSRSARVSSRSARVSDPAAPGGRRSPDPAGDLRSETCGVRDPRTAQAQDPRTAQAEDFPPPKSPEESLKAIVVRPGMKVGLVAAEPLVVDPVAFDWGPDGRLWVVEMRDYPNGMDGQGKAGGRIKVLEDSDGDGRYDQSHVFLDELPYPTGVMVWRKGILITAAPDVIYAEDADGDQRADIVEKLYTGFGEGNQQHRVNGLRWGLDNWVHLGNGDSNGVIKSHKTGETVNVSGRDLRIRPDEGLLDATSGNTQFGRNRDDWGAWFGGNNSNPMWHYVLDDRYLRRNPHVAPPAVKKHVSQQPGAAPVFPVSRTLARFNDFNMAGRFTSACSPIIYRDVLLGEEFYGDAFVCEPVHNLVHREVVQADGVTFTSRRADDEQQSEFFASADNWCRPSMVRTGPDGALWIADMYRFVIEHPRWIPEDWQRRLDVRAGDDRGRIYRVYPEDSQPRPFERLDTLDAPSLVAQLESPNGWRRDMAHQMLLWRGEKDVVPLLDEMAASGKPPQARVHALCVLDGLQAIRPETLMRAVQDEHPQVRRHAVRLSEPLLNDSSDLAQAVAKLADDPDPCVVMQVAYSLGEWDDPQSGRTLGKIALAHHDDEFLLAAALSSADKTNLGAMLETVLTADSPPLSLVKMLLAPASAFGEEEIVNRVLASLAAREGDRFTAQQMDALAGMIETLDRRTTPVAKIGDETTRERLAAIFAAAQATALNENAELADRQAAVRLLGSGLGDPSAASETLGRLLVPQNPIALQSAAVAALTKIASPQTPGVLLAGWRSYSPALRADVLDALLSRSDWTRRLLEAVENSAVPAGELEARRRQQLLTHKDENIRTLAEGTLAEDVSTDRAKIVEEFRHVLNLAGDATRGKEVFRKRCATCHRVDDEGHPVGPDLTALTNKSPEALLVAILDPNRAVEDKFLDYIAITNDGRQFTGVLRDETGASITLEGPEGKKQVLLRKDLETLHATGKSLMPEGMEKDMTADDLADAIAYVRTIGPPPKQFAGNQPETVRVSINGRLSCLATNCRIYGPTVVFEEHYRNLGYWQSEEDRAVWTIEVPQSGRYRATLDYACHDSAAGDAYVLEIAGQTLTGRIEGTGTWDNYRGKTLGEVDLPQGVVEMQFRSAGPVRQALLDLRGIRLTPVE